MSELIQDKKVLIGISGGINSAGVLCWLKESKLKPKELHLFYIHFDEHSPDTYRFVEDLFKYAEDNFENVFTKINHESVLDFFDENKMIPHPIISPCSKKLKIEPVEKYCFENEIDVDLIGYVKHELNKRTTRQKKAIQVDMFTTPKKYPIGEFTDEWCFKIVKKHIGWYPEIYDIKDEKGKRVFLHNNCLPCKNMQIKDFENVKKYYPEHYLKAMQLSGKLSSYWGRDADKFYLEFGRDLGQDSTCGACKF